MQITRSSIDTAKGPSGWFTGDVYVDAVAAAPPHSRVLANLVLFMPGARTHWHRHPVRSERRTLARGRAQPAHGPPCDQPGRRAARRRALARTGDRRGVRDTRLEPDEGYRACVARGDSPARR